MGTIMKNNINYSGGGGSGASTAAAVSYNNTASGLTSGNAQGAIDELAEGLASKADAAALDGKADRLTYNESSSTLLLQSGGVTLSSVHIEGGSIATIVHVQTHEQSWWNNPAVTIDVKDSDEEINNGHFDANGDYVVKVHHIGTYTVTVTDDQGRKYVTTFEDNQLGAILYVFVEPYGWEGWLNAASMATTAYSSLDDVLADEKALRELFTKHASVDYLVTWLSHADTVTSVDEVAHQILDCDLCAKWINLRDYALDMLYANAVIKAVMDEIDKYGYGEWALVGQVPKMTSNTSPMGEASAIVSTTPSEPYRAFDGNFSAGWNAQNKRPNWIQYKFVEKKIINGLFFNLANNESNRIKTWTLQGSNDGSVFIDIISGTGEDKGRVVVFDNNTPYQYYRLYNTVDNDYNTAILELQFYAWQPKGNVPIMTSNTAPYGTASASSISSANNDAYHAFIFDYVHRWQAKQNTPNSWVQYKFVNPICAKRVLIDGTGGSATNACKTATVQASNDGTNWVDLLKNFDTTNLYFDLDNDNYYLYYRVIAHTTEHTSNWYSIWNLQFYGRQLNVSVPVMTSNTAPWGEVSTNFEPDSIKFPAWHVFDGNLVQGGNKATCWSTLGNTSNFWVAYKFTKKIILKYFEVYPENTVAGKASSKNFKIQYSDDGAEWTDIYTGMNDADGTPVRESVDSNGEHQYYRFFGVDSYRPNESGGLSALRFFGISYSEREFEEGSTMKYIYDHGVELETLDVYGNTTKNGEIIINPTRANNTNDYVVTNAKIDLSSYKLSRITMGDAMIWSSNGGNYGTLLITRAKTDPYNSSNQVVLQQLNATTIKSKYNIYIDINSVNEAQYVSSGYYAANSTSNGYGISEWWLE